MIKGLHHNAYRCRDSEETRVFYEDFLGLRLVSAFEIDQSRGLHTFFEMDDGSCLAFFEVPGLPFDFKQQNALDLHIALGVEPETFESMLGKAKAEGREVRGPVDHGFVRSIYFHDPNGYVIELTASTGTHGEMMDPAISKRTRRLSAGRRRRATDRPPAHRQSPYLDRHRRQHPCARYRRLLSITRQPACISKRIGGSSGCSGCVSDQCVRTVRELVIVTLSKERLGRRPLDAPDPQRLPHVRTAREHRACATVANGPHRT